MALKLHFQSTGTIPGESAPVAMTGASLTIGRGAENDLALPDPSKVVSKHHAAIEDHGGNVVIIDLSTNGTFLNYGKVPLGKVPTPLNDGDILTVGPYELMVELKDDRPAPPRGEDLAPLAAEERKVSDRPADLDALDEGEDDFLDDLLGGKAPSGHRNVSRPEPGDDGLLPPLSADEADDLMRRQDEDTGQGASQSAHSPAVQDSFRAPSTAAPQIPEDWGDDLSLPSARGGQAEEPPGAAQNFIPDDPFGPDDVAPTTPPQQAPQADPFAEIEDAPAAADPPMQAELAPPPPREHAPAPGQGRSAPAAGGDAAAQAFLAALGVDAGRLSQDDLEQTMANLGRVMHTMIAGIREVLMTRASIKSEFRIEQTRIGAGNNNPLKFSISPEQAVEAMVKPSVSGYLDPVAAARQALDDIRAHEVATMTGMEAAIKGILAQLAPERLEGQIEAGGGLTSLLKGRKARYWEVYEKIYGQIADQAETEFHDLFAREFARAYQRQLERLKGDHSK